MKKQVIVLHGTGGNPDIFWQPYLKDTLDSNMFKVSTPQLPSTDTPDLKEQLPYFFDNFVLNKNTILVGHSAGCKS